MTVATTGKFDVLHHGHCIFLDHMIKYAIETKSIILILIDSDARIVQLTGKRPVFTAGERVAQIKELIFGISQRKSSNAIYVFDSDAELEDIYRYHAEREKVLLMKGKEWEGKPIVGKQFVDLYLFDTGSHKMSSSIIKERIKQWYADQE